MATASSAALRLDRRLLGNGLTLLHSYAAANPSVAVRALVRAGASREAPEDQGLAGMAGRMLRQGTVGISKQALAEELDGMGAGLAVDVGYALTSVSIKCMSDDFGRSLEIVGEVLRRPTFPAEELERVRGQALTDIREMNDNTRVVAERAWREHAYPSSHRYHRLTSGTEQTVTRFTRDDVASFHDRWFGPNQTTLIVVGNVSLEAAREKVEAVLGDWRRVDAAPVEETLPAVDLPTAQYRDVTMPGKTQCDVVTGLPALSRKDPDYYPLAFGNHILGRIYFMGRFGEKVRDEQGLAYYAYSELQGGYGRGPWLARAGVNPRNVERALGSLRAELERFLADGPTEAEMADGIRSLIGSLPRQLETNDGVAAVLAEIDLYDLGLDYLDRYPQIISSLTHQQVVDASRRWLLPDRMVTAVAGPERP